MKYLLLKNVCVMIFKLVLCNNACTLIGFASYKLFNITMKLCWVFQVSKGFHFPLLCIFKLINNVLGLLVFFNIHKVL